MKLFKVNYEALNDKFQLRQRSVVVSAESVTEAKNMAVKKIAEEHKVYSIKGIAEFKNDAPVNEAQQPLPLANGSKSK